MMLGSDIAKNEKVINRLQKLEYKLCKMLGDNAKLLFKVVDNIVLYGKLNPLTGYVVGTNTIYKLVWEEYPDLYENIHLEDKNKIFYILRELNDIVWGNHRLVLLALRGPSMREVEPEFYNNYRNEIERHIKNFFYVRVQKIG